MEAGEGCLPVQEATEKFFFIYGLEDVSNLLEEEDMILNLIELNIDQAVDLTVNRKKATISMPALLYGFILFPKSRWRYL